MYLSHYNLKTKPFQMSTDPKFLWLGEKHKEALATLKYAIAENKGVLALTGDVGTGKTTLINALRQSLGKDVIAATIYDPSLKILDFFNIVAAAFNMEKKFSNKGEFLIQLRQFLIKALEKKQKVLLLIDEAQTIGPELLEEIRLLSNLEEKHIRLLNIFFVGQSEFVDILQERKNRALRQRITINYNIESLTLSETETYIKYRLQIAGTKALVFDAGAIQEIFSFSGGYPRLINILCDHALLSGFVKEVEIISTDLIRECKKELRISEWDSGQDIDTLREGRVDGQEKVEVSEKDADSSDDEDAPIRLTRGLYREAPTFEPEKKPFNLIVLGVALIVLIGGIVGYVYFNTEKGKNKKPGDVALKQYKSPYSGQLETKKDDGTIVPSTQTTADVQSEGKSSEILPSDTILAKEAESGLLKEIISEEVESPDTLLSDRISDEIDIKDEAEKESDPWKLLQSNNSVTPQKDETPEPESSPTQAGDQELKSDESKTAAVILAPKKEPDKIQKQAKLPEKQQPKPKPSKTSKKYETKSKKSTLQVTSKSSKPKGSIKALASKTGTPKKITVPVEKVLETSGNQKNLKSRLQAFLTDYSRAYENKQLDKFTTFFAHDAVEGGKRFRSLLPKYRRNFEIIDSLNYRIDLQNYSVQKDTGIIKAEGIYYVRVRLINEGGKWQQGNGKISMVLTSHEDSFQIKQLNSIEGKEKVVFPSPTVQKASLGSSKDMRSRLQAFLTDYSRTYENKQLDKFTAFFTLDALEKGKPFRSLLPKYRSNFEIIDSLDYRIELKRFSVQESTGFVRVEGTYYVRARLINEGERWRQSSGGISMELASYGDSFRVRRLDY